MTEERTIGSKKEVREVEGILNRSLTAGYWSSLDILMQKVLIFGAFFITARILTPQDFGTIALAAVFPNLLDSLTAIAFDTALTQKKEGEEKSLLNVVWTFNLLRTLLVFVIVFFGSYLFADFFHVSDAVLLFQLSALPIVFQGLTNIGQIYFFKRLEFKKVFLRDMANYGTAAVVSVTLALTLHTYWALFIGTASGIFMAGIATYLLNSHRPKLDLGFSKLKPLLTYSEWVFGQALTMRIAQTLEDTLVGRFTDTASVGNFSKAKSLAYAPTSPLSNIISKIGFSALVATGGSIAHVREGFYKSFDLAISVAIPFIVIIWIGGTNLVLFVLGSAWAGIIPLLKTLVVVSALNTSILSLSGMTFNALNKPQHYFKLNIASLVSTALFLPYLVITHGIAGAALSLLITAVIVNMYALILIHHTIALTWKRIIESTSIVIIATLIPLPLTLYLLQISAQSVTGFFLTCALFSILYLLAIFFIGKTLHKGPAKTLLLIVSRFVR